MHGHPAARVATLAALLGSPATLPAEPARPPARAQAPEIVIPESSRPQPPGHARTNTILVLPGPRIDGPPPGR